MPITGSDIGETLQKMMDPRPALGGGPLRIAWRGRRLLVFSHGGRSKRSWRTRLGRSRYAGPIRLWRRLQAERRGLRPDRSGFGAYARGTYYDNQENLGRPYHAQSGQNLPYPDRPYGDPDLD